MSLCLMDSSGLMETRPISSRLAEALSEIGRCELAVCGHAFVLIRLS